MINMCMRYKINMYHAKLVYPIISMVNFEGIVSCHSGLQ